MQKEKKVDILEVKGPLLWVMISIIVLIEIFDVITDLLWKLVPFKKKLLGVKEWFHDTRVYKGYKNLVNKALGLDEKNFLSLIIGMAVVAIPFIYILPVLLPGLALKVLSVVIGKVISSSSTTLIALGADKLLKIEVINKIWTAAKNKWQSTKDYFNNLKYVKKYRIWKDKQEGTFLKQLKFFSSKIKDRAWRKNQLLKMKKVLDSFPFIDKLVMFTGFILLLEFLNILTYFLLILIVIRLFQSFGSKTEVFDDKVEESEVTKEVFDENFEMSTQESYEFYNPCMEKKAKLILATKNLNGASDKNRGAYTAFKNSAQKALDKCKEENSDGK